MSVVYENAATKARSVYTIGAVEVMLHILADSDTKRSEISTMARSMASDGLRVLCIASKSQVQGFFKNISDRDATERDLECFGLVGVYDPPRPGTLGSFQSCHPAGITVHVLTGDHISTSTAIAQEVGIIPHSVSVSPNPSMVMAAGKFDVLSDSEIDTLPSLPLVIARCSPKTKANMPNALHRRKAFCIMTENGVNDPPALKRVDVRITMGLVGSDVGKDCTDMVLTDMISHRSSGRSKVRGCLTTFRSLPLLTTPKHPHPNISIRISTDTSNASSTFSSEYLANDRPSRRPRLPRRQRPLSLPSFTNGNLLGEHNHLFLPSPRPRHGIRIP